jgi:predicted AlkP superfamily phosphohydrolase/phosphomutase
VFSTILRVPITFPPEKFKGVLLSAMCVPDLKGSQGTYYYYSSEAAEKKSMTSGVRIPVEYADGVVRSHILGPENTMRKGRAKSACPSRCAWVPTARARF